MSNLSTRNIMKVWRKASPDDIREGLAWYEQAYAVAKSIDPDNPNRAAGVIAALSPLTSWDLNVRNARAVYRGEPAKTLSRNAEKARRIHAGEEPLDVLSGNKVRAFYLNIIADDSVVTLDRHAINIAAGKILSDGERNKLVKSKQNYENLCTLYRRAAKIASRESGHVITPRQLQAATWTVQRRTHARGWAERDSLVA